MTDQKINLQDEKNRLLEVMYQSFDNQKLDNEIHLNPVWRQLFEGVATLNMQTRFLIERNLSNIYYSWLSKISKTLVSPKPAKTILKVLDANKHLTSSITIKNNIFYSQPVGSGNNKIAWKIQGPEKLIPLEIVEIIHEKNKNQLEIKFNYYGKNKKETLSELNLMINREVGECFGWLEWFISAENVFIKLNKFTCVDSNIDNLPLNVLANLSLINSDDVNKLFFDFYKFPQRFSMIKLKTDNEFNLFDNATFSVFIESKNIIPNSQIKDLIAVNCFCVENNFSIDLDPLMLSKKQNSIDLSLLSHKDKLAKLIDIEKVMLYSGNKSLQVHEKNDNHPDKISYQCRKNKIMEIDSMELLIDGDFQTPSTLSVKANVCQENYPHIYLNKNHFLEIPKTLPAGLTALIVQKPTIYEQEPDPASYEFLWNEIFSLYDAPIDKFSLQKQIDFYSGLDVDKTVIHIEEVTTDKISLVKNGVMTDCFLVFVKARCKENSEQSSHYLFGLLLKHYFDFLAPLGLEVVLSFHELNSNRSWDYA